MEKRKSERASTSIFKRVFSIVVAIFLFAIQIAIFYLIFFQAHKIPYVYLATSIIAVFIALYIYNTDQNSSYKLTWIIVVLALNFFGPVFYILFASGNHLPTRKAKKIKYYLESKYEKNDLIQELEKEDIIAYKLVKLLNEQTSFSLYKGQNEEFYTDGKAMFEAILSDIETATNFIFIEFFIIRDGFMLNALTNLLFKKAQEGVEIKIIYDAIGTGRALSRKTLNKIRNCENIDIIAYNPLGLNLNLAFNYRDHRKLVVIDGKTAYVGGINISDEYINYKKRFGYWRDCGMVIRGNASYAYTLLFAEMWYLSTKETLQIENYRYQFYEDVLHKGYLIPFGDGPVYTNNPSYDLFMNLINNAQKSIYISTPYFIIDKEFIYAIVKAIKSGVEVKILLPGIPDKKSVFLVSRSHYRDILMAGGQIYEYMPGFNHSKEIIVDEKYAFIGTVNIDYRSMFLHFECGNFLINTNSIPAIVADFNESVEKSKLVSLEEWKKRSVWSKLFTFLVTIFGPLL